MQVTNPRWSAPEVIRSSTVSRPADVFSFGVVMWELLTWQQPYEEMMSVQVQALRRQNGVISSR
jgi:serine/threonine protein kinase